MSSGLKIIWSFVFTLPWFPFGFPISWVPLYSCGCPLDSCVYFQRLSFLYRRTLLACLISAQPRTQYKRDFVTSQVGVICCLPRNVDVRAYRCSSIVDCIAGAMGDIGHNRENETSVTCVKRKARAQSLRGSLPSASSGSIIQDQKSSNPDMVFEIFALHTVLNSGSFLLHN